ncbi:MAG: DUF3143 domain-containing protein [Crocosphaera sp.]|nr:DUF3143 domain-containing protein [Crocosphaera sp.]
MTLPAPDTPLYNHPLPVIEQWLSSLGCQQDQQNLNCWTVTKPHWKAQLSLDVEEIIVSYLQAGADGSDITRAFKYSLSREDVEAAVFSGP